MNPEGKVALITGGGVRVGQAISLGLAKAGAHVIVHYNRSAGPAEETVAQAQRLGVDATAVQADLTHPETTRLVVQTAMERFGKVDIMVHAASPFLRGSLFEVSLNTWQQVMGVVVESFLILVHELSPGMIRRGEGVIIPILDRGVVDPWPDYLAHSVAKNALWALGRNIAVELAPQVRVNGIVPGPVLPPASYSQEQKARIARGTLLQRWGTPQDVVDAILCLIRSDYVTGEILFVDGGERWTHRLPQ